MKHNRLILTVLAVGCFLLLQTGCQQPDRAAPQPKPAISPEEAQASPEAKETGPRIKFERIFHNFGNIGPITTKTCEFKFTNTGDSLMKIKRVSKTCSCTPFALEKREYAPGESGVLKVKYTSAAVPGLALKRLYVYSNDETEPKISLTMKAQIVLKIDYKPKKLKLLLRNENAGCPQITLSSIDNKPFAITKFQSTANSITTDYDPSVTATSFVLNPKVDVEKLQKSLNGHINISLTHPECKTVLITYNALPEFKTNPAMISVFNVEPQKPVTRTLWVLSNYDEDFEVESASSKKGFIKVLSQEKVGKRYKLELEIMPPEADDKLRTLTDDFIVNIKGGKKMTVMCRGFYAKS
ncbi:MAG: DUF1573 domain-containing protein [Planctomycetota bacterium]|jgi:hypothetical protein